MNCLTNVMWVQFITVFGGIAKLVMPGRKPYEKPAEWHGDDIGKVQVALSANA